MVLTLALDFNLHSKQKLACVDSVMHAQGAPGQDPRPIFGKILHRTIAPKGWLPSAKLKKNTRRTCPIWVQLGSVNILLM